MTDELINFLRARLDEDKAAARDATPGPWWHNPGKQWLGPEAFEKYDLRQGEEFVGYGGPHPFTGAVCSTGPASNMQGMKDAEHIARHDPARVLREVEAKQEFVRAYEGRLAEVKGGSMIGDLTDEYEALVLPLLALPYSDHPDYRTEWRP